MSKRTINRFLSFCLALVLSFGAVFVAGTTASARGTAGIRNNGTEGIYIDIYGWPYSSYANIPTWGQYAYGPAGCAWFASSRVRELTGKGTTIYSGQSWYSYAGNFGFSKGKSISAKGILCFSNHVAIAERVYGDTVIVSEGGHTSYAGNDYCVISYQSKSQIESRSDYIGCVYICDDITNYSLDVNAKLDGADKGTLDGIATVDVYINGKLVADDVSDYFVNHPKGTAYEIKDVKITGCAVNVGVESMSGTLNANADCRFTFETAHRFGLGRVETEATCTEKGVMKYFCMVCQASKDEDIEPLGHEYFSTYINPTCTENAKEIYTCARCFDTYDVDLGENAKWSEWSTEKPTGDGIIIQEGVQYRYYDKETKLSSESQLEGWEKVGSKWDDGEVKSVSYVSSWPAGFDKNNSLYAQYNKTAPTASETDTKKIVVGNTSVQGYIYWHWCSSSYNGSQPMNRYINDYYTAWDSGTNRAYDVFHAFYSTEYKGITASAGAVDYWNSGACNQVYWWYPALNVMKTEYTEYTLVNEFTRDTDWSEWSTQEVSASDTRIVETRTVYRYSSDEVMATGHSWDEGTKVADGGTVYICKQCGETSKVQQDVQDPEPDTNTPDNDKPLAVMKGDVNSDGKITASDARLALRISAGLHTPDAEQKLAADVNGDSKITASDARKILRVAAGLDEFSKN